HNHFQIPAPINSIYGISEVVCRALGVALSDIKVKSRVRDSSIARQACMAILRAVSVIENGYVPKYSFKEIADSFNKDHATVIYSCNKFYRDYKYDIVIRKSLEAIIENCDNVYIAEIASKIKDGYYENAITKRKKKQTKHLRN